tara:strand:- start:99 stop:524 length:426 start_codon:yes stop_codon:yes gene_type:complete
MKSFLKIFGLIIGFNLLWSIVFFIFQPKSQIWADMGILEAFIYLLGALAGDVIYLIISFLLYLCLFFLKKSKKVKIDNIILFSLGYALVVIIAITLQAWLQSRLSLQFNLNIASLTNLFYTPFIYCFVSYNLLKPWILKKS